MNKNSKIFIAGGTGLVGSAIIQSLIEKGYSNIISSYRNRIPDNENIIKYVKLDLLESISVEKFFSEEKPEYVILAAAKVGGIVANNTYRADFIYENLQVQNNVIHQSYLHKVKKLLFLGSTCIYPKNAPQPMVEESLLTSPLEYTNEPYAIAKIAGIKMCESYNIQYGTNFMSVMPTNLYGPNDNFDLETSHVLPALLRKIHLANLLNEEKYDKVIKDLKVSNIDKAKKYLEKFGVTKDKVEIGGIGSPRREFMWSKDMADACIFIMEKIDFINTYNKDIKEIKNTHLNIGTGKDISIKELAILIKNIVGYSGELYFNIEKPDGTILKRTDISKLDKLGWKYKIELEEGVKRIYEWYKNER